MKNWVKPYLIQRITDEINGFNPTVRAFMKDFRWCSLDPDRPADIEKFKKLIRGEHKKWVVGIKEDLNPYIARIIIARAWEGNQEKAKSTTS